MLEIPMLDNQIVTVQTNPLTAPPVNRPVTVPPVNFQVLNPNPALLDLVIRGVPGLNPEFDIIPKFRFFGGPQIVLLTIRGQADNFHPPVDETVKVLVTGSDPDNGKLDHWAPTNTPPVPQS